MSTNLSSFAAALREAHSAVFFGGAGVSTESGVKDYRSKDGLYSTVREYGVPPETILSHSFFESDTDVFYDFYYKYFLSTTAAPNPAHIALAELERLGKLSAVITQNSDGLHQAAGSKNVRELHGTVRTYHCADCGNSFPKEGVVAAAGKVPRCESCGGKIKPDVVLYEEPLDDAVLTASVRAMRSADLLIIGGTSLNVYPAAGLIRYFSGNTTVLINRDETPFDSAADIVFHDKIGVVMSEVMKLI